MFAISARNTVLKLGKFNICVKTNIATPKRWEDYQTDNPPEYLIRTSKARLGRCSEPDVYHEDSPERSTFYFDGRAKYALLRPDSENEMRLLVRKNDIKALNFAINYAILVLLSRECIGLHCVTVRIGDKLIALSAPSGTGKTTLSKLLEEHAGAEIINGDFALLSFEDGRVMFEPTPFCGSSRICKNIRLPLDGIAFLSQSPENTFSRISPSQALVPILSNTYIPEWLPDRANDIRCNAVVVTHSVPLYSYAFAPNKEAADLFRREILK